MKRHSAKNSARTTPAEIEVRILIDPRQTRLIWSRLAACGLPVSPQAPRNLRERHFETPDQALGHAGYALILRRQGRDWLQTIEIGTPLHQGVACLTALLSIHTQGSPDLTAIPDSTAGRHLKHILGNRPLIMTGETQLRRKLAIIGFADGTQAALVTDTGTICAAEHSAKYRQATIRLISGDPRRVFDLLSVILPEGGLAFSEYSQARRGQFLAEHGRTGLPPAPVRAARVRIAQEMNALQAALAVLGSCFDQIASNVLASAQNDDPEGPHQLRVGLRRLRSAFLIFRSVLDGKQVERLNAEARWLGAEVGRLRDLDVLSGAIVQKELAVDPLVPGLARLARDLASRAAAERRHLGDTLRGRRVQALLIDLSRFIATSDLRQGCGHSRKSQRLIPIRTYAAQAFDRRWRKVLRNEHDIDGLDPAERHELRKELKKLRYATDFLAGIFPEGQPDRFIKLVKTLQDDFGTMNDSELTARMLGEQPVRTQKSLRMKAENHVIAVTRRRAERAWSRAVAQWPDLRESRPFWA